MRLITAITLSLLSSAAMAESLNPQEQAFIANTVGILKVMETCPSYEVVTNGMQRYGDSLGVDVDKLGDAIMETMKMASGKEYNRSLLIPAVTRFLQETFEALNSESHTRDFCQKYPPILIKNGVIHRKG